MPHVQTTTGSGSGRKEVRKMGKAMQKGRMGELPLEELEQKEQELSRLREETSHTLEILEADFEKNHTMWAMQILHSIIGA